MALRITRSIDPIEVKRITACLYAVPGIGKTSTAFTAEKPILLDFDRGAHRSRNRKDSVQVETWEDVLNITQSDLAPYKTVIIDTAGRALDTLVPSIITANPKMGRGGALTLQGYGQLKTEFIGWTKMLMGFGLDVVLLCHSDESKHGDDLIERLDMQGASKNEIYKSADVMGRLYLRNGKRMLNFSPTDVAFGKNPAGLDPIEVPDFGTTPDFFSGIISKIKASLNQLSAEQTEVAGLQAAWKEKVDKAESADDFTVLIESGKGIDERIRDTAKRVLLKAASDKGFVWPKGGTKFESKPKAEAKSDTKAS